MEQFSEFTGSCCAVDTTPVRQTCSPLLPFMRLILVPQLWILLPSHCVLVYRWAGVGWATGRAGGLVGGASVPHLLLRVAWFIWPLCVLSSVQSGLASRQALYLRPLCRNSHPRWQCCQPACRSEVVTGCPWSAVYFLGRRLWLIKTEHEHHGDVCLCCL